MTVLSDQSSSLNSLERRTKQIDSINVINTKSDTNEDELQPEQMATTWKFWRKRRYVVCFMIFLGLWNVYALRVNLSVGIVAMTENRTIHYSNGTIGYEMNFDWNSKQKGLILSAFFYGYICTQFLGGYISSKFQPNVVFGVGVFATALLTLFTPMAANAGVHVLIAVRFVEGLFEGVSIPSLQAIYANWAPPLERARMGSLAFSGCYIGTVVAMPLSGMLAESFGWESIFYFFGLVGCLWFVAWIFIVKDRPENDKAMSADELRYISSSLASTMSKDKIKHPWKKILTSAPVLALCAANFTENWATYTLLTQLPTFLKDTLNFNIQSSGILSALPYLAMSILLPVAGILSDYLVVKGFLNTTQIRKYLTCGSFLSQTIFLLLVAYLVSPVGSLICIVIGCGLGAFAYSGFGINFLDIAPQHASVIVGISNTIGTIPGIVSPTLSGYLVQNKLRSEWQKVFFIGSSIYLIGCIIYWIWCSGELQPWAVVPTANRAVRIDMQNIENGNANKLKDNDTNGGHVNPALELKE